MIDLKFKMFFLSIFHVVFLGLGALSAQAHMLTIVPDTKIHEVVVGSAHRVDLSFTDALLYGEVVSASEDIFSARFLYVDGTETKFPDFTKHFVSVDVVSKDPKGDVTLTARRSFIRSQAALEKTGTVLLDARGKLVTMPYMGYTKQILNAGKDGLSMRRVGGDEVLEIVPLSEVADYAVGKTVRFRVFLKGQPLEGATVEWADEKSTVTTPVRDGRPRSPQNTEEIATTDAEGVFSFTLRNAGYNSFGLLPGIPSGKKDKDGKDVMDYYASTLIVDVPSASAQPDSSKKSDGNSGCDAGFGGLALVLAAALLLKRKA